MCRAGFEDVLAEEVSRSLESQRSGPAGAKSPPTFSQPHQGPHPSARIATQPGWLCIATAPGNRAPLAAAPYVFERQRMPRAQWSGEGGPGGPGGLPALIVTHWGAALAQLPGQWTLHAFAPHPNAEDSLTRAALGLGSALRRALCEAHPGLAGRYVEPDTAARMPPAGLSVLQMCRVPGGAWTSLSPAADLSDPWPGGVHRIPDDPLAPSRSFAKIEEAFEVMGSAPRPMESAVDLGAAPGGWSWAFVKRGCRVVAVDNGPLKLKSLGDWGGELEHVQQDGMTFAPSRPVDWLASDMLIAPGAALGLVRRWHRAGWARRMVVNFKLPQRHPLAALDPVRAVLDALPGFRYRLRQLYHDRREVTLMAECETAPGRSQDAARRGAPERPHPHRPHPSSARPGPARSGPQRRKPQRHGPQRRSPRGRL